MEKTAKAPPGEPGGKGFSPAFGGAVPFPPSLHFQPPLCQQGAENLRTRGAPGEGNCPQAHESALPLGRPGRRIPLALSLPIMYCLSLTWQV
ncbi:MULTISPECIES: hypothetical protein [unclassified Akkermansia]|uniref:hypothetical protein n=1 Tax=unclassified Akkermansia TaxID=2608915 RepID=UPI00101FECBE|nr:MULTISPECIES: hypothetical protein [unclassified Akkermansia]KAA3162884.1 hypothetical protein F2A01_08120 [Akkermansia sp. BIOML-A60]KAA3164071.1 hypothetical protein F2A23_09785 [Akkermansia sp. BIOML-A63]KAA3172422.1 hypothetical protein F2A07_07680 [Akkermansia sp. BIOML-A61]KAA3193492.1 hypothetical protein F2A21_08305 [Akkermansia sp. BIOML-A54]KAA3226332.1 hypothetical protein F1985_00525 [Akkermansia sp. BIOML-A41]KAA3241784.1 hypothetical protein F1971_05555 [Akkermansia sp. BIOML